MWIPNKSYDEIYRLYQELVSKYGNERIWDISFKEFMDRYYFAMIEKEGLEDRERVMPSELMEIYSEFDITPNEDNPYVAHANNIEKYFGVDKNILEVAGGIMPALSSLIARKQLRLGSGTVTMIDPKIIDTKSRYSNLKLQKQEFTKLCDVSNFDLLVGIMSCGVTGEIIESATKNNKDFYIAMCGCPAEEYAYYYSFAIPEFNYLIPYARELVENNNMGTLEMTFLDAKYEIPYPIIYNKRK